MQLSAFLLVATLSICASASPSGVRLHQSREVSLNQGSDRLITQTGNGEFTVDPGIVCTDSNLASQIACLLDQKDCKDAGKSDAECTQQRIDCQSGNGINGQSAQLNKD